MSALTQRTTSSIRWIWSHIAATVGLVLIVAALVIGYSIGNPAIESSDGVHEHSAEEVVATDASPQMYTCSMHPTVRLKDPKAKCPICFMDLIPVMDNAGGEGMEMRLVLSEASKAMSQIETTKVGRFYPSAESRLFGKLVYDETSVARLSAYFPGRIDRLFVNYVGVTVQEGDHLAKIYSPDLLAAFEELRQAKKSFDLAVDGSQFLRETSSQTLIASREKLRLFGLTQQQVDDVETGSFDSDELTIYSPIGGVVTHLAAREGDYLKTGDPIATVSDLSRLWLDLEAYESQLAMLRWGLPVTFTVEAHPGEEFEGQISFIEPIVDERTRTAAVRVAVDNTDMRLKPGMFSTAVVRAKVAADGAVLSDELAGKWVSPMHPTIVKNEKGTCEICGMDMVTAESLGVVGNSSQWIMPLVIPRTAVLFTGTRSVVYIQVPDQEAPTYEGRTIELGTRAGDYYTVRSGLKEGDDVVVHGAFRIDSAMQILAKPSMMMPSGGGSGGGHNHGGISASMPQMDMKAMIPQQFVQSLSPVYSGYLDAQERLAADDLGGFLDATQRLGDSVDSVTVVGLVGESLGGWRRSETTLKLSASVTTIDDARIRFEVMTHAILDLQDQFGNASGETLYTAFCPMAFDFEGAKWIQRGTEINNPYFGSQMIRCGDIQETHEPINQSEHDGMKMGMDKMSPDQNEGHDHE